MASLVCYSCERTYDSPERVRCDCGEPVWFDIAVDDFRWPTGGSRSLWRYRDLLPVDGITDGIATAAGGTPLIRTPRIDVDGCRVHVKDETENPTGTFKDRGSAVGIVAALESGTDRVGTVSHGNMAMSMAAHAAGHGLECVVLVPPDISDARLRHISRYAPEILKVTGPYGELYYETLAMDTDVMFVNSDTPYRVAGQKTVAFEIHESFAPTVPDAVVLPVSSGGQFSAVWKATRELRAAGLIDRLPRLYGVQSAARAPIAAAVARGDRTVEPVPPRETIAYSIGNVDPPSGNRVLAAIRETNGGAVSVADDELRTAQADLARRAGVCVESSSAVALAGIRKLRRTGALSDGEDVVMIATGTGFKEHGGPDSVETRTVDFESLGASLRSR